VVFSETAETPQSMEDWQFSQTTYVAWNRDGTPWIGSTVPWSSYANSLNYNDGTDYHVPDPLNPDPNVGYPNRGRMTSRWIPLSGTPVLTFRCAYETETEAAGGFDVRRVQIATDDTFQTIVFDEALGTTGADPAIGACAEMGVWHTHTVALNAGWGAVRLRLSFDTVDGFYNSFAGWFVDDITVTGAVTGGAAAAAAGGDSDHSSGCSAGSSGASAMLVVVILGVTMLCRR
jgi:hypothetical protein